MNVEFYRKKYDTQKESLFASRSSATVQAAEEEAHVAQQDERWGQPGLLVCFGRLKRADHLRAEVQDQPGPHGETPSLQKYKR
ncbi:hypothetical protein AAY473_023699 [Plecturocebus cupreus]